MEVSRGRAREGERGREGTGEGVACRDFPIRFEGRETEARNGMDSPLSAAAEEEEERSSGRELDASRRSSIVPEAGSTVRRARDGTERRREHATRGRETGGTPPTHSGCIVRRMTPTAGPRLARTRWCRPR